MEVDRRLRWVAKESSLVRPGIRLTLITTVAVALAVWDVAFELGAFGTVFFERIFAVWVFVTASFLGILLLGRRLVILHRWEFPLMALPSLYLALAALGLASESVWWLQGLDLIARLAVLVICVPYTCYRLFTLIRPDLVSHVTWRYGATVAAVATIIAMAGFLAGHFNQYLLYCYEFRLSGNYVPPDCRPAPEGLDATPLLDLRLPTPDS